MLFCYRLRSRDQVKAYWCDHHLSCTLKWCSPTFRPLQKNLTCCKCCVFSLPVAHPPLATIQRAKTDTNETFRNALFSYSIWPILYRSTNCWSSTSAMFRTTVIKCEQWHGGSGHSIANTLTRHRLSSQSICFLKHSRPANRATSLYSCMLAG